MTLKFFKDPCEIRDECVKVKEEHGAQLESGEKMLKVDEQLTMEFEDACETKIKIEKEPKSGLDFEDEKKAKITKRTAKCKITNSKHCLEEIPSKSNDVYVSPGKKFPRRFLFFCKKKKKIRQIKMP